MARTATSEVMTRRIKGDLDEVVAVNVLRMTHLAPHPRCLVFDWGDTLMRDIPGFTGPMADWPRVETMPGAAEVLAALGRTWTIALATNAGRSDDAQIRAALARGGIDRYIDQIYCARGIGHRKPARGFFEYIIAHAGCAKDQIVVVGDNHAKDIEGAVNAGLRAIWLDVSGDPRESATPRIRALRDLPNALAALGSP
jgi:putative hydrolase of the HAD superfamily